MSLTQHDKKALVKNLIDLAKIDGEQNEEEMMFIHALAEKEGITADDLRELSNSDIQFQPPENAFDRIEHMHKLMLLMATDQTFSDVEKEFIRNIGLRMGIRDQAITNLIEKLEKSPNHLLSPEEIISVYNTYYN